ncbi:MAG: ABC transporter substrate-binding protein [Pseudomonadota bacterium]
MTTIWKSGLVILTGAVIGASSAWAGKDSVTMGLVLEPPHLDPTAGAAGAIDDVTYGNIFEGLTRIDETGAVRPALARTWSISDDGLTYTFTLADGVTFHDGASFEAEDVVFSLNRAMAEDSVNAQKALFSAIDTVSAPDDKTVVITLKQPAGNLLFNLGWGDAVIVDPASAETNKQSPVGTGPFKLDRWVSGDRVELVRNPDYWGEPVALQSATMKFIPDPAAAAAALLSGDVDGFANFPAAELVPQFEADPRFQVVIGSTEGETLLSTNNAAEPFNDPRVRQAIAHALNRQDIIDGLFGYGTPIGTHFAPHHPAYVDLVELYPHDPERAKALLAEAGYPEGFEATLKLPPPSYARRGGEIVAAQLADVGIEVEIIPVEWAQWLDQVFRNTDYDLTIVSHTEPMDIGIYGRDSYYFNYDSPAFKALVEELNRATDEDARYTIMRQMQQLIAEDAVNGYMFQLAKLGIWNKDLQGLWHNSPVQQNVLTGASWAE